jgi:hypothetical protein
MFPWLNTIVFGEPRGGFAKAEASYLFAAGSTCRQRSSAMSRQEAAFP